MRDLILAGITLAGFSHAQTQTTSTDWLMPIHTAEADPVGGDYGTWASGPDYKISFHDGVAFYPVLGPAHPENLPLIWRTESITHGEDELVQPGTPAEETYTDWRFERRLPGIVEAYDVRRDGVEQTFVLARRPTGSGDLVVTGRIETALAASDTPATHGDLTFHDDQGEPIVRYGRALALDARGDTSPMTTAFANGRIRLTVDGDWLRDATYPVTLDPLISSVTYAAGVTWVCDVVRGSTDRVLRIESRQFSSTDYDLRGHMVRDDLSTILEIYRDVTANWSTLEAQCAFVGGATYSFNKRGRFVIAMHRVFSTQTLVRAYTHDGDSNATNSGATFFLSAPTGVDHRHPSVGGTRQGSSGTSAFIAYESVTGGVRDIEGVLLGAASPSVGFGNPFPIETNLPGRWSNRPCVMQTSDGGSTSWVMVWSQEDFGATGEWIETARIRPDGSVAGKTQLVARNSATDIQVHPKVAGSNGRYMVVLEENTDTIRAQRFDWPETSSLPLKYPVRDVATSAGINIDLGRPFAHDYLTQSHWTVAYSLTDVSSLGQIIAHRLGYDSGIVETVSAFTGSAGAGTVGDDPSVCFNHGTSEFIVMWHNGDKTIGATRLAYDPAAAASTYGTGCAGTIVASNAGLTMPPYAGSEFLGIDLDAGAANGASVLVLAGAAGAVTLPSGCALNVSGPLFAVASGVTDGAGDLSGGTFVLPSGLVGDLYWQWFQIDPSTNALVSTAGLRTSVW